MLSLVVYSYSLNSLSDDCASYRLKVGTKYIVYDDEYPASESLTKELKVSLETDTAGQWRIPDENDLDLIEKCPQLRAQLADGVYYWTKMKIGVFYKCFKIDKKAGKTEFENRIPSDGAYRILIREIIKNEAPPNIPPSEVKKRPDTRLPVTTDTSLPLNEEEKVYIKYRVRPGNDLSKIAKSLKHDTSKQGLIELGKLNGIYINGSFSELHSGQLLKIPKPACCKNQKIIRETKTVLKGDTLNEIASEFLEKSFFKKKNEFIAAICTWNGIRNKNRIRGKQTIIIYICE